MPNAVSRASLLGSAFGRRLLILFAVCSLFPTVILAVLAYGSVTKQLREASLNRLDHTGRTVATGIAERLRVLTQDFSQIPSASQSCAETAGGAEPPPCDGQLLYGLTALGVMSGRQPPMDIFGRIGRPPALTTEERLAVRAGQTIVVARTALGAPPELFLVRQTTTNAHLVGAIHQPYLWGSSENPLLPTMELHVVDRYNRILFQSTTGRVNLPTSVVAALGTLRSGTFEWSLQGTAYLASYTAFGRPGEIDGPRWTVVLSEARTDALASMADFKRTFPLVMLVSLAVALLVTLAQLDQSLAPLRALQEGTRRLASQDFNHKVVIESKDEFADVAASFNAMADQIGRQFKLTTAAAEIDRAVLSSVDTNSIVRTVFSRIRELCPCETVGLALVDPAKDAPPMLFLQRRTGGIQVDATAMIPLEHVEILRASPHGIVVPAATPPRYLASAAQGTQSILILPLFYKEEFCGTISLGSATPVDSDGDEWAQVRRLAGQVAVALTNARMVEQIRMLAFYDSLTGLPNRVSFKRRLSQALEEAERHQRMMAVCFLDLDRFSRINDTLGHNLGDRLVQAVGVRVKACCLQADAAAEVARLGGDEFTVIMPDVSDTETVINLVKSILAAFETPFSLGGHEVFVSTSVGVAMYPGDGTDLESLLKNADVAMYRAKEKGRNTYQLYAAAMNASAAQRLTVENQLRKALDAGQFALWYQPIADLATGQLSGAEALVRWQHPEWGTVPPAEFIGLCEESGLIVPLGSWILKTVCEQNRAWQRQGFAPIPVSINLSGHQIRGDGTVEEVRRVLAETGLDPQYLVLELTESILMENKGDAPLVLQTLASLGVGLAIDDFGTGYSSLSYLKHFPVNTLKIDQSFIREVNTDQDDAAITTAIIAIASALGLRVVAEGIETQEQVQFLRREGCNAIQGYLVGRPVAAPEFVQFLQPGRELLPPTERLRLERTERRPTGRLKRLTV